MVGKSHLKCRQNIIYDTKKFAETYSSNPAKFKNPVLKKVQCHCQSFQNGEGLVRESISLQGLINELFRVEGKYFYFRSLKLMAKTSL